MSHRRNRRHLLAAALGFAWLIHAVAADDRGTREEAVAMVNAAVEHAVKVGTEQAYKDFSDKSNKDWHKKDLYVYAYTMQGLCLAHGVNEHLIGKNLIDIKDPNGRYIVREIIALVSSKGAGWTEFEWTHPITKRVENKTAYSRKLVNADAFLGVGVYH